jgi:hypothetical protein
LLVCSYIDPSFFVLQLVSFDVWVFWGNRLLGWKAVRGMCTWGFQRLSLGRTN